MSLQKTPENTIEVAGIPFYYVDYGSHSDSAWFEATIAKGCFRPINVEGVSRESQDATAVHVPFNTNGELLVGRADQHFTAAQLLKELTMSKRRPSGIDFTDFASRGSALEVALARTVDELLEEDFDRHLRVAERLRYVGPAAVVLAEYTNTSH